MPGKQKRLWLRFSLGGILLAVTLVAACFGWNAKVVRQRKAAIAE